MTLEVSKLDKSKYSNSLHPSNIAHIFVIVVVSDNLNFISFNDEHLLKIKFILFNFSSMAKTIVFSPILLNFFLNTNCSFVSPFNIFIFVFIS